MTGVVAYVRVSSKGQDHTMQRAAIEKTAAARGVVIGEWYAEKRSATKTMVRPELDRLREAMRAGAVRLVFAFRLDRLVRTGPVDALRFAEECHRHGVELHTVSDGVRVVPGSDDVATQVLLFAFGLVGKLEAAARAERIAAARELAEAKGRAWGRPKREDYRRRAEVVERLARGESVRAVAAAMGIPRSTVARYGGAQAKLPGVA